MWHARLNVVGRVLFPCHLLLADGWIGSGGIARGFAFRFGLESVIVTGWP